MKRGGGHASPPREPGALAASLPVQHSASPPGGRGEGEEPDAHQGSLRRGRGQLLRQSTRIRVIDIIDYIG